MIDLLETAKTKVETDHHHYMQHTTYSLVNSEPHIVNVAAGLRNLWLLTSSFSVGGKAVNLRAPSHPTFDPSNIQTLTIVWSLGCFRPPSSKTHSSSSSAAT